MKKRIEFNVDIGEFDLLRVLAKERHMEFALDDNTYCIKKDEWGEPEVWMEGKNGSNDEYIDDRAELFVALRNLANAMCPNCEFRSERTIYDIEHLCI